MKKIQTLYTCGCSWTAGEELASKYDLDRYTVMYYNSWPWFVAQNLEIPVLVNEGRGSGSNFRIFRKTFEFINDYIQGGQDPSSLLIILGWTTPDRYEIGIKNRIVPMNVQRPAIISTDISQFTDDLIDFNNKFYELYSDEYGQRLQILFMTNLRLLCKSLGLKYYDFIALGKPITLYPENAHLQEVIKECFGTYVAENNLPVHEYKHPTKETHKIWADLLCEKISISL